ncbi:hypothetical protein H1R20_g13958, partial [Candolleomyces eurysporus]
MLNSPAANFPTLSPDAENIPLASNTIYERQLLQKKHGFPLWIPHPNVRLPKSYTDKGVSVGDVGIITPHGAFDYLFNVCLHAEHPNNSGQLPEGFVPLLIQQKDIAEHPEHGPGSHICSSSVTSSRKTKCLSFQSGESEGAILTLPEGAIHEDVRNLTKFREYAALHAPSWYRFANGVCGREIENGELHLVTGCDKTTSWGMATFSRLSSQVAVPTSLDFRFDTDADGCICSWEQAGNAEVKSNSNAQDSEGNRFRNQCTFIRSYTVTLSEEEWAKVQASVEVSGYASDATTDTVASRSSNLSKNALKRLFSSFSQKSYPSSQRSQSSTTTKRFTDLPTRAPHPSTIINKLLLAKHPRARVGVTHDEEWAELIPDPCNPPSPTVLWEDIQARFDVILDASGGTYLSLKEPPSSGLEQKPILADIEVPLLAESRPSSISRTASDNEVDHTKYTLESLMESLATSETPDPAEARLLVKMLSTQPPPAFPALQRVLLPLFCPQNPATHSVGFAVMASYWENPFVKESKEPRLTSDRLACFTFFLDPALVSWSLENWEIQFKSFKAVTKDGTRIVGVESVAIDMLKKWLLVAFQQLAHLSAASETECQVECERCVLAVGMYLVDILKQKDNVARIYEDALLDVLKFHATLIDQLILIPGPQSQASDLLVESPISPSVQQSLRRGHKKRGSSLSLSNIIFSNPLSPTPATPTPKPQTPTSTAPLKHPAEHAIALFLEHLNHHLLHLTSSQLWSVLPPLFRGLAFCASPLPRLTLQVAHNKPITLEDRIVDLLNTLAPSASFPTCVQILKHYLFPYTTPEIEEMNLTPQATGQNEDTGEGVATLKEFPFPVAPAGPPTSPSSANQQDGPDHKVLDSLYLMIMTGLGASRTLRNYVRRALAARLENVYHAQDTPSANRSVIDQDLLDVVWLRHNPISQDRTPTPRIPTEARTLASSIDAWVAWDVDLPTLELSPSQYNLYEKVRDGREHILEESAGILKDIYQEFDGREERTLSGDECELDPINDGLKCLSAYLVSLQSPDGSPFIVNAFHPGDAPTPLLRSITTLLSRDFSRCNTPLLAEILLLVCDHVTDDNTAGIPTLMMDKHLLNPISPEWIDNWRRLLSIPTLMHVTRPQTRKAIIDALHDVYFAIKDIPPARQALANLVVEMSPSMIGPSFCDPLWRILEDDAVSLTSHLDSPEPSASVRLLTHLAFSQPDSTALPVIRTLIDIFSQISFTAVSASQIVQRVSLYLFQSFSCVFGPTETTESI